MEAYLLIGSVVVALIIGFGYAMKSMGASKQVVKQVKTNEKTRKKMAKVPKRSQSAVAGRMRKRGKRSPKS